MGHARRDAPRSAQAVREAPYGAVLGLSSWAGQNADFIEGALTLRGIHFEELTLEQGCDVVFALWVEELAGLLGDRAKVRRALLMEFERLEGELNPETWGTSELAQQGQAGMLALARRAAPK